MLKICRVNREGPIAPSRFAGYLAVFPSGAGALTLISNGNPPFRTGALRNALTAVDMDRPSSSRMAVASFLASGSIQIVVAGIFDGMASPLLVYRDATILLSLCGGFGPVVHLGRQDVEHIMDAAPAHAVGELSRDRALGGAGAGRHEGSAPPEAGEVGIEVLRRHAPKRLHEGVEERVDGVDPVDGPPGVVLGIVGLVRGDLELGEDADVGGRPVGRDDGAGRDAAPRRVHGAPPRKGAPPRDLEERLVRVVHAGHNADPLARQPAPVHLLAAVPGGARHRERPPRVVALERLGEVGLVELAAQPRPALNEGEWAERHSISLWRMV